MQRIRNGRPPWKPDLQEVENLASKGLTQDQIAAALGVGRTTLYKQKKELVRFKEAIERGQAAGISVIANRLFEKAQAGDTTAMIFYLKARAGWRDQPQIVQETTLNVAEAPKNINVLPPLIAALGILAAELDLPIRRNQGDRGPIGLIHD